jgi:pimeloyl-ACP methyl ester carboxylesterase
MIHAFPGMGADRRMYPSPWNTLPSFVVHDWPCYDGELSIADVAKKLAELYEIRDGDSLVGASLGGIVACEIAKIRKIKTLYLIGSAKSKNEVNLFLSILHPLADIAPISWIQFSAGKIPSDLTQMFADVDASFIRAMCSAIFEWDGFDSSNTQVFRVHGLHDFIIPPPQKVDLLVDGGHLISMTHAKECVTAIIDFQNENL